jgi:ATP-dependent exoDNAse (exonuclease V) beta subunit
MEYDEVTLAGDFITEEKVQDASAADDGAGTSRLYEEINLLYVAVTRAKSSLHVPENIFPELETSSRTVKLIRTVKAAEKKYNLQLAKEKSKSGYAPWTKEDDKMLMEMFNDGKTMKQLAKIFDRTTGGIIARIKKLNLD